MLQRCGAPPQVLHNARIAEGHGWGSGLAALVHADLIGLVGEDLVGEDLVG